MIDVSGKLIRAYVAKCMTCRRDCIIKRDVDITKADAVFSLRNFEGWVKTKAGWRCGDCIRREARQLVERARNSA